MIDNVPFDLKAESLLGYLPRGMRRVELRGSHKRNAYEDMAGMSDDDGMLTVSLARDGIYDILPESMFHPIDRFDNIPANEYKERFKEECESQQAEEDNARRYFQPFDNFLIELSTVVSECKNNASYSGVISDIICDRLPEKYLGNRFVRRTNQFIPICRRIRGDKTLFSLMLRHILFEESISVSEKSGSESIKDVTPRYNHTLDGSDQEGAGIFLGDEFDEGVTVYDVRFWKEDECDDSFLDFVAEMNVFEDYLNDFFIGLETRLEFDISAESLPVRLADDVFHTYLDYNTNL